VKYARNQHQGSAKSASTKLEVLGTVGVPYKRFEVLPVSTARSKPVETRRIVAKYFLVIIDLFLRAPDLDGMDNARAWNKHYFI
jgi:hypothetical protein